MRAVVQRVNSASVEIDGSKKSEINKGLLVLIGICNEDDQKDIEYLVEKIMNLRIFEDEDEKMNLSLLDIDGEILIVSQFTLFGDCRKGRRPSFIEAAKPDVSKGLYEDFLDLASKYDVKVASGEFGADMKVALVNDGPVTILIDSKKNF